MYRINLGQHFRNVFLLSLKVQLLLKEYFLPLQQL